MQIYKKAGIKQCIIMLNKNINALYIQSYYQKNMASVLIVIEPMIFIDDILNENLLRYLYKLFRMKTLVFIRLQQIKFLIRHSRFDQKLRLTVILILFMISLFLTRTKNPFIYLLFPTIFAIVIQHFRKDYFLLQKTGLSIYTAIFIEYLILSSPFIIAGIVFGHTGAIAVFILFLAILPHVYPILNNDSRLKK